MSFIKRRSPDSSSDQSDPFFDIIHLLVIMLSDLAAGPIEFQDVLGIRREPKFSEFVMFLQMMEVYGGGYQDDVDYIKYNLRNTQTHTQAMIEQLERVIYCYDLALKQIDLQRRASGKDGQSTYKD